MRGTARGFLLITSIGSRLTRPITSYRHCAVNWIGRPLASSARGSWTARAVVRPSASPAGTGPSDQLSDDPTGRLGIPMDADGLLCGSGVYHHRMAGIGLGFGTNRPPCLPRARWIGRSGDSRSRTDQSCCALTCGGTGQVCQSHSFPSWWFPCRIRARTGMPWRLLTGPEGSTASLATWDAAGRQEARNDLSWTPSRACLRQSAASCLLSPGRRGRACGAHRRRGSERAWPYQRSPGALAARARPARRCLPPRRAPWARHAPSQPSRRPQPYHEAYGARTVLLS
jgi:hypothetical protein